MAAVGGGRRREHAVAERQGPVGGAGGRVGAVGVAVAEAWYVSLGGGLLDCLEEGG